MKENPNFWDNSHRLSEQAHALYEQLVPATGNCETLQGELLRASSKIGYDWYNNGWGCNNWSGAVLFLREHIADLPNPAADVQPIDFHNALLEVHQFSHGEPVYISDERADQLVTAIHEYVVAKILANPGQIPNELDMWDYREPDYRPDEDDDNDWYDEKDNEEDI